MRYYRIELNRADDTPIPLSSYGAGATPLASNVLETGVITSLLPDGTTNPAALNIELDIEQLPFHMGDMKSYVRIYGLAISDIFRRDLNPPKNGKPNKIKVSVGMEKGLPLADWTQKGLVVQGEIYQAFGNWLGTDMTLDLVIAPGGIGSAQDPKNYILDWKKGQKLSEAVEESLKNSPLADQKRKITISDDRVAAADKQGVYRSTTELAQAIQRNTVGQRGEDDLGVYLYMDGQTVTVADTAGPGGNVKEIKFKDLIGQVTWFEALKMTCKLVMRGDLDILGLVKFPQGANVQTQVGALSQFSPMLDKNTTGIASGATFQILRIHHWGNFRQPDAMSWNTTLELSQQNA